jgi:hypothetical protein
LSTPEGNINDPYIASEHRHLSLVVWATSAQQLTPKPGFTEKRERVLCGRMGCEAKIFYARPGCRRVQTGGFVGLPGAFKVVCGGQ